MVKQQVITIGTDGSMSGLQVKPGRGVDLRQFGKASIVRASEIEWDEDGQGWKVTIQDAPGMEEIKGVSVTGEMAFKADLRELVADMVAAEKMRSFLDFNQPLMFDDYDRAVEFEIAYLDAWRLKGRH